MKTSICILLVCLLAFTLPGCKSNTVDRLVVSLGAVSAAAAIAIAVATSLDANEAIESATAAKIVAYSQAVSEATSKAIAELSLEEPARKKIVSIAALFAGIPSVAIAEQDPKAAALIQAIQVAIQTLMVQLNAAARSTGAATRNAQALLTPEQAAELISIDAQARDSARAAAAWGRAHRLLLAGYMK
ncbi:MAG TPA: hypothetical protein VF767_09460 [Bryobacteraceae bacterium]